MCYLRALSNRLKLAGWSLAGLVAHCSIASVSSSGRAVSVAGVPCACRLLVSEITRYRHAQGTPATDTALPELLTDAIEQWATSPASDHPAKIGRAHV